tara:strand:+ start:10480 stop:11535 length:1056 start_codon:yes stop_codon:yes gene_type:complete
MKKILLLLLGGIGDSLLFTPTISALRKIYPEAKITALARDKPVKAMLERNKQVDEILHYPFLQAGYIKSLLYVLKLRKEKYDLSILAYPANRMQHNIISFLIGAKKRLGHIYEIKNLLSLNFLHTKKLKIRYHRHCIDENLTLLRLLGIDPKQCKRKLTFTLTKKEENYAQEYFKKHHIQEKDLVIGMHPGSSKLAGMMNKRWPKEKYAALADKLIKKKKAKILLFGGNDELPLRLDIQKLLEGKSTIVTTGSIFETAALLEYCDAFVSNDTALMHLASYYQVPSVILLGHLNPNKTKPQHKKVRVLMPTTNCKSYRIGEDLTCKYKGTPNYCLNQISVEETYKSVEGLLQ